MTDPLKELKGRYDQELRRRCAVRGWCCNNFTCYLLESNRTASRVAVLMGANFATTNYWLYQDKLSSTVNFLFLMVRKLRSMQKVDLFDLV